MSLVDKLFDEDEDEDDVIEEEDSKFPPIMKNGRQICRRCSCFLSIYNPDKFGVCRPCKEWFYALGRREGFDLTQVITAYCRCYENGQEAENVLRRAYANTPSVEEDEKSAKKRKKPEFFWRAELAWFVPPDLTVVLEAQLPPLPVEPEPIIRSHKSKGVRKKRKKTGGAHGKA